MSPIISDVGKNSAFQHKFYIAPEHLQSLKGLIFVELSQNGKVVRKEKALTIYRPGVSNFVNDINQAIKQMKYILTNQELSEIKGKNRKEVEKLFFHLFKLDKINILIFYQVLPFYFLTKQQVYFFAWI